MVGSSKYLSEFKDKVGKVPKLGDKVVASFYVYKSESELGFMYVTGYEYENDRICLSTTKPFDRPGMTVLMTKPAFYHKALIL